MEHTSQASEAFGSPSQEVAVSGCVERQGGEKEVVGGVQVVRQLRNNAKPWKRRRLVEGGSCRERGGADCVESILD